jgi:hypothetical protein
MKALSVKNPWAELIACGRKTIELRTWQTSYRGPIVIVSSASPSTDFEAKAWLRMNVGRLQSPRFSRAVALVELVGIRPAQRSDAYDACCRPGPRDFAWELRLLKSLEVDIHVIGKQSLYTPPLALIEAVRVACKHSMA